MRLTDDEVASIREAAVEAFGPGAVVRLFGSRLDDGRRGGDIDLYIQPPAIGSPSGAAGRFRRLLEQRVGEREYDILVAAADRAPSPVERRALAEGTVL